MVMMIGRKLRTPPTPSKIPPIISSCTVTFTFAIVRALSVISVRTAIPSSSNPCSHAPITLNVRKNTMAITQIKIGIAVYFPVSHLSIRWLRMCSLLSFGLITHSLQTLSINAKRISAMAALLSRPLSFSICFVMCSKVSISFSSKSSFLIICASFSMALLAANLTGISARFAWSSIR